MKGCTRLLSVVGLLLIVGGLFVGGAEATFACFDGCASNVGAYAPFYMLGCMSPGLIFAGLGWVFTLLLLIQEERRWRAAVATLTLPICIIGGVLAVLVNNAGHLPPGGDSVIPRWEHVLTGALILLPIWPLITLLCTIALPRQESTNTLASPM